jgi:hypothetical protein
MPVHAFRVGSNDQASERNRALVAQSLREGFARFGWSYIEDADLRHLSARIEQSGWESLSEDEKNCYQGFLLDIAPSDSIVYVDVPERGRCTIAKVVADPQPYTWLYDVGAVGDFRHAIRILPDSLVEFERESVDVHPFLRMRLKLPRRHWRISAESEFLSLYEHLLAGQSNEETKASRAINHFRHEAEPHLQELAIAIYRTHPNFELERLLTETFARLPNVTVERRRGRANLGADIVLTIESGLPIDGLSRQEVCLVQVKSHVNSEWSAAAVTDLERAFKTEIANMGLIATTATSLEPSFERAVSELRERTGKPIGVLYGARLAEFIVRNSFAIFS